jgi:Ca2+-transporting ATPase
MQIPVWHALDAEKVLHRLRSDHRRGLTSDEVGKRLAEYGPNELRKEEKASSFSLFLGQFKNLLILILLAATVLSLLVGEWVDALMIAARNTRQSGPWKR